MKFAVIRNKFEVCRQQKQTETSSESEDLYFLSSSYKLVTFLCIKTLSVSHTDHKKLTERENHWGSSACFSLFCSWRRLSTQMAKEFESTSSAGSGQDTNLSLIKSDKGKIQVGVTPHSLHFLLTPFGTPWRILQHSGDLGRGRKVSWKHP